MSTLCSGELKIKQEIQLFKIQILKETLSLKSMSRAWCKTIITTLFYITSYNSLHQTLNVSFPTWSNIEDGFHVGGAVFIGRFAEVYALVRPPGLSDTEVTVRGDNSATGTGNTTNTGCI